MRAFILTFLLLLTPMQALAHKVIAGVFPAGNAIEGEIGFSSGKVASGAEVIVTAPDGTVLGQAVTDQDGFFVFTPTQNVEHRFRADLGAGHVADVVMSAADVAKILGVTPVASTAAGAVDLQPAPADLTQAQREILAELIRDEIRPLRREIAAYREKNDLQTVLGGIGYIAGLFGLGFYIAARRKLNS